MMLFGKGLKEYARFARLGIALILLVGVARFVLGVSGVPYERATHLVSLTITTSALAIVYGARAAATRFGGLRQLLPTVALLAITMYGFIVAAILVEGLGGMRGYFHAPGHGLVPGGMSIRDHVAGQLLAMLFAIGVFWVLAAIGFALWHGVHVLARRAPGHQPA
jgi:hypothetical protein